ncbi:DUF1667 domain-containing protein [Haliovirga abyssi]|uniref:Molybdopterin oxidoreductase n=1 Tax=Haliovirga abyssi TaxID=2996794 RepID=A0AAU9DY12_9FUSO|nr:DUF1667 domain-containing protein [Haliovirga abyssi]BDU51391.1 molybdopterin oxidoreductase [Haliovirga abyssi]
MKRELICITCPMGCRLTIESDKTAEKGYKVTGNSCKRGEDYAIKEVTNPTRVITSTVKIKGGILERIPVKTDGGIPKDFNYKCMDIINEIELEAPVKVGDVVYADVLGTGVNIVATRSMERV